MPAGDTFTQFNTQAEDEVAARVKIQSKMRAALPDLAKGAAVGPFTMAPDLLGLAQQMFAPPWVSGAIESGAVKPISGDPLREAVGLDPRSPAGMVGEVFGGWENLAAKGGTAIAKATTAALTDGGVLVGSLGGLNGYFNKFMGNLPEGAARYDEFLKMEKDLGMEAMDMRAVESTGWVRGHDGHPKFIIADDNAIIKDYPLKEGENNLTMGEFFGHDELYAAYPEAADLNLTIFGEKVDGNIVARYKRPDGQPVASFDHKTNTVAINEATSTRDLKGSLLHEIQHTIQRSEGHSTGAAIFKEDYFRQLRDNVLTREMIQEVGPEKLGDREAIFRFIKGLDTQVSDRLATELVDIGRMYSKYDTESFDMFMGVLDSTIKRDTRQVRNTLEMATRSGTLTADNVREAVTQDPLILHLLSADRYKFKLGELEATLAQYTQSMDRAAWNEIKSDPIESLLIKDAQRSGAPTDNLTKDIIK